MKHRAYVLLLLGVGLAGCGAEKSSNEPTGNPPGGNPPTENPPPENPPPENPPEEPSNCQPTSGGPHSIVEGEPLSATIHCATGQALPADLVVEGLPTGATYEPESGALIWTPGLDQAAVYEIVLRVPSQKETTTERIGVTDRWEAPDNVPVVDFLKYPEEHGLPVLNLVVAGQVNATASVPATVTYGGHVYAAEAQYLARTTLKYPKKSFSVTFAEEDRFSDAGRGFTGIRTIELVSSFDDNSYIRGRLASELWKRLDAEHVFVRSYNAVVYLNGVYHGLYLLAEKVDGELMGRFGLRAEGNLFQAVDQNANFSALDRYAVPKPSLSMGYEKMQGLPLGGEPGAFDDLEDLVNFVATSTDEDFRAGFAELARQRDYENWWLMVMFTLAGDSDEKNTYHYHDPEGGPWRMFLLDFNWSFGQNWQTLRELPTVPRVSTHNLLFKRLLDDPGVMLRNRLKQELRASFALEKVLALVDEYQAEVKAAALRDELKWGAEYSTYFAVPAGRTDFLNHEGEAAYLRTWIEGRWQYLDGRF
jgi:hypothetical protein